MNIKQLDSYCKKKGKRIVIIGNKLKGFMNETKTDDKITMDAKKKLSKGKVF